MALTGTDWQVVSGDWDDPADWTNGVPTSELDAVFFTAAGTQMNVTGDGLAASITILGELQEAGVTFTGNLTAAAVEVAGSSLELGSTARLSFQSATIGGTRPYSASLRVDAGATLGTGALTFTDNSQLSGTIGVLANTLTLDGEVAPQEGGVTIDASGTISGAIDGSGLLTLGADETAASSSSFVLPTLSLADLAGYSGSIVIEDAEVAFTGSIGGGPITSFGNDTISAASASPTVFQGQGSLEFDGGSGHATVVGEVGVGQQPFVDELNLDYFGTLSVDGGAGTVTVFGEDAGGTIIGGAAGGNVIVAGAVAAGYAPESMGPDGFWKSGQGAIVYAPKPVTIEGGGNGDLLVVTGVLNNEIAAAGGNETLTGSSATGNNTFFSGNGADEIVAGGGQDTVVGTGGSATVFGGTGSTAIFTGPGAMEIVGGKAADYVQVGQGASTLFAGGGADVIGVVNGASGGSLTVVGFRPGIDQFNVQRYTLAPTVTAGGGNTVLTFQDHTSVTLVGVPANLI